MPGDSRDDEGRDITMDERIRELKTEAMDHSIRRHQSISIPCQSSPIAAASDPNRGHEATKVPFGEPDCFDVNGALSLPGVAHMKGTPLWAFDSRECARTNGNWVSPPD